MPPKKGKKGGKKKAAIITDEEFLAPFGFRVGDMIVTPLGAICEVVGVKCDVPGDINSGRLIVQYPNKQQIPLEPRASNGNLKSLGYWHAPEAMRIQNQIERWKASRAIEEDQLRRYAQEQLLRMEAFALEGTARRVNDATGMLDRLRAGATRPTTAPVGGRS
ncbi:unnamed protein product [Pedinophyceae sp. YPF-701]|nr:unnamed protein product [Pedinophyceae sp. YPF-701]